MPLPQTVPAEANYDESKVGPVVLPPLGPDGAIRDHDGRATLRSKWLDQFADQVYGAIPDGPDDITIERSPLSDPGSERISITISVGTRRFRVDAALWLPSNRQGKIPLLAALDFLGPAGTLYGTDYPLDPNAAVSARPSLGMADQRLGEQIRGASGYRWPIQLIHAAGWGVLTSCYGSWVPDNAEEWTQHGLCPLLGLSGEGSDPRAISLWAWALSRLVDVAEMLPEVDASRIATVGHSRLGKVALWAAANDERITDVLANDSGCFGVSLAARNFGETPAHLRDRFPHWVLPEAYATDYPHALDQHQLLACVAPRRLYVASAIEDLWCDPQGEYHALQAALPAWDADLAMPAIDTIWKAGAHIDLGSVGWHVRPGGHDLLPYDWRGYLAFLAQR